jgi:DNA-binding NarL/FixJ family response regulator
MAERSELERGRECVRNEAWQGAFDLFSQADARESLDAGDLEQLGRAAYMLGRDEEYVAHLERAHRQHLDGGAVAPAIRCAFWIGHSFLFRGERARAGGWFARAQRLLDETGADCVEQGYLLAPVWLEQMGRACFEEGRQTAVEAEAIGRRFGDADLIWLARDEQARALLGLGRADDGLRLIDEALVVAGASELSPIMTGIIYCNTIAFCAAALELRHVREWTAALTVWCDRQPEMIAHNGLCLVHRAETMLLTGDWSRALTEAREAAERFTDGALNRLARGRAFYCQGEVHRLRGDFQAAEEAYRSASQCNCEPQPGLTLMRLAQHKLEAAATAIRRVVGERTVPLARAPMLPVYVSAMIATGSLDSARAAVAELEEIAVTQQREVLQAIAAQVRGELLLAEDHASDALPLLRQALAAWTDLGATYESARLREQLARACRLLGDEDTASFELGGALRTFEELGALPDVRRLQAPDGRTAEDLRGLTGREVEVLRCVAAGKTNRQIADQLCISEFTVARHVQNIFAKLDVASRTAATAFAYAHRLV